MKQKINKFSVVLIIFGLLFAQSASAGLVNCGGYDSAGNVQECTLGMLVILVIKIINTLLSLASVVAIFFIVWSGWEMINAAGHAESITKAKSVLENAIVGFFLILISYLLIATVITIFTPYKFTFDYTDPQSILRFLPLGKPSSTP